MFLLVAVTALCTWLAFAGLVEAILVNRVDTFLEQAKRCDHAESVAQQVKLVVGAHSTGWDDSDE